MKSTVYIYDLEPQPSRQLRVCNVRKCISSFMIASFVGNLKIVWRDDVVVGQYDEGIRHWLTELGTFYAKHRVYFPSLEEAFGEEYVSDGPIWLHEILSIDSTEESIIDFLRHCFVRQRTPYFYQENVKNLQGFKCHVGRYDKYKINHQDVRNIRFILDNREQIENAPHIASTWGKMAMHELFRGQLENAASMLSNAAHFEYGIGKWTNVSIDFARLISRLLGTFRDFYFCESDYSESEVSDYYRLAYCNQHCMIFECILSDAINIISKFLDNHKIDPDDDWRPTRIFNKNMSGKKVSDEKIRAIERIQSYIVPWCDIADDCSEGDFTFFNHSDSLIACKSSVLIEITKFVSKYSSIIDAKNVDKCVDLIAQTPYFSPIETTSARYIIRSIIDANYAPTTVSSEDIVPHLGDVKQSLLKDPYIDALERYINVTKNYWFPKDYNRNKFMADLMKITIKIE